MAAVRAIAALAREAPSDVAARAYRRRDADLRPRLSSSPRPSIRG